MRILFLIRALNRAGAERQLVALARGLRELGYAVGVVVFYGGGPLERDLCKAGVEVRCLNKRGRWDVPGFLWRLIKAVRQFQPDILHGYLCVSNILSVALAVIFPRIRVVCGVRASDMDLSRYDWAARILYWIECRLSRFADLIIVNSRAGLDHAASNGFPTSRMIIIPNGIDTERFLPDPRARARLRAEWGVGEADSLVGLVARLDPMKDHETFLKAAALVLREHERTVFVCVGGGADVYKRELVEKCETLGLANHVIWAGERDDIPAVYNALDLLVSSSVSEGFPNVIGEAMACGVSCVVTDVGDSRLIVGNQGEIVPPRDAQALKTAITRCLSKRNADGDEEQSRRQRIIERFSTTTLETRTEAVLLQLCKSH